jgi:MFS family permease
MSAPREASVATLAAICLASLCWAFSFGAGAVLAPLWLKQSGYSDTVVGLSTGTYYFGIALAAGAVPWMLRRWGAGAAAAGMVASGVTVALFPWGGSLAGWFGLRLLNGVAGAMSLIPLESLVNQTPPPDQRARNFGFYAFCIALGMALGYAAGLELCAAHPRLAFYLGGVTPLISAAATLAWLRWPVPDAPDGQARHSLGFRTNFLSFGSAWTQGFLEGAMVSFLAIYLLWAGCTNRITQAVMAGTLIGVILFQVPVAWLADRLGRTAVLIGCYVVVIAGLACLPFCTGTASLVVWLFLVGACSGTFYPLGLAILGERIPPAGVPRASAWYLAINCVGSLVGPVACGVTMDLLGKRALFAAGEAAVLLVFAAWLFLRLSPARQLSGEVLPARAVEGPGRAAA